MNDVRSIDTIRDTEDEMLDPVRSDKGVGNTEVKRSGTLDLKFDENSSVKKKNKNQDDEEDDPFAVALKEGQREGQEAGRAAGWKLGHDQGQWTGMDYGLELGFYQGIVQACLKQEIPQADDNNKNNQQAHYDKVVKTCHQLQQRLEELEEAMTVTTAGTSTTTTGRTQEELWQRVRARYKLLVVQLGWQHHNPTSLGHSVGSFARLMGQSSNMTKKNLVSSNNNTPKIPQQQASSSAATTPSSLDW